MRIDTHLILVSAQATPNLTPLLDSRFRPERVVMLVSEDMARRADDLAAVIKPRGIKVERFTIEDPWDVEYIRDRVMELLDQFSGQCVALNATGGTKPMSIAAYEIFRVFDYPIFYVHPERDRLIWMHPQGESVDLADRIGLREYLVAYGAGEVKIGRRTGVSESMRTLTDRLIRDIERYADKLSTLNYLASFSINDDLTSPEIDGISSRDPAFRELLDRFEEAGLLNLRHGRLEFPSEEARFLVNGGWLELYVYGICLNLKKPAAIQDVAHGIEVARSQGGRSVLNEIDVGLLKDNRLFIMECKTKRYGVANRKHDEVAEVLYKLDSLRDLLGGAQAKSMLISFNRLKNHQMHRAAELKIQTCCYNDLRHLKEKLRDWIAN